MLCPADLTPSTHFLRFVQSSECEWIAVLRVTRGTHQFSLDFLSKWLEMSCSQKEPRVRIPNSPPKTQSYQGFCPYDWAFLFSQGHIGVHDFRQELRCASRSALCPAESGYCPLHLPRRSWTCNPNDCKYSPSCRCRCGPATPGFASEAHRSPKAVRRSYV